MGVFLLTAITDIAIKVVIIFILLVAIILVQNKTNKRLNNEIQKLNTVVKSLLKEKEEDNKEDKE